MRIHVKYKNPSVDSGNPFIYGMPYGDEATAWKEWFEKRQGVPASYTLAINDPETDRAVLVESVSLHYVGEHVVVTFDLGINVGSLSDDDIVAIKNHPQDIVPLVVETGAGTDCKIANFAAHDQLTAYPNRLKDLVLDTIVNGL